MNFLTLHPKIAPERVSSNTPISPKLNQISQKAENEVSSLGDRNLKLWAGVSLRAILGLGLILLWLAQAIVNYEAVYKNVPNAQPNPLYPTIRNAFFVKHWRLSTSTPLNPVRGTGAPAQGNPQPIAVFGDHAVVQITPQGQSTQYYDPSYGNGPYSSLQLWQDASIDGFGVQFIDPSGLAANFVLYVGALETPGILEITYGQIPYNP